MKEIKILLLIIVILVGVLAIKIYTPERSKSLAMSKEEIMQLLQKGNTYDSYVLKYRNISDDVTKVVKGNIVITGSDLIRTWHNLETKEQITVNDNAKTANIFKNDSLNQTLSELPAQVGIMKIMNSITDSNITSVKTENYKGKDCIVVQCEANIDLENYEVVADKEKATAVELKFWIESATGLVIKQEGKNANRIKNSTEFNIELNTVKDTEIEKPNLDGYQVIQR